MADKKAPETPSCEKDWPDWYDDYPSEWPSAEAPEVAWIAWLKSAAPGHTDEFYEHRLLAIKTAYVRSERKRLAEASDLDFGCPAAEREAQRRRSHFRVVR